MKPIVRRLLRGGFDPVEAQKRSVASRRAKKLAREQAAAHETADKDLGVRVPDVAKRKPFESWAHFYAQRDGSATPSDAELEREEWQGRPRTARMPSPDVPDERLSPREFDLRHGVRAAAKVRKFRRWYDRREGDMSPAPMSPALVRGEDFRF